MVHNSLFVIIIVVNKKMKFERIKSDLFRILEMKLTLQGW